MIGDNRAAAQAFATKSKADETVRAYRHDFALFESFCAASGYPSMPATPSAVAEFLASETARATLSGIKRVIGAEQTPKTAATADVIAELLKHCCSNTLTGKRDQALIALGFAGAFRRSELVSLEVADLTETPDGLRVLVRRSKTDQTGQGQEVAILRGRRLRPVEAVQTWLGLN